MGLMKYLHRKKKYEARGKHVNPFADESSQGHSSHSHGSSHSHSSHHSSGHSSAASSRNGSGTSKHKAPVDELLDVERQRLVEAFRIIDKDRDGKISKEELGMMWQRLGEHISEEELRYMIQDADGDGDGLIDFDEFVALQKIMGVEDQEQHMREIRMAFNIADVDKSGLISAMELQKVMTKLGHQKVTLEECIEMCRVVDSDGDGMICFEEFERLMRSNAFQHEG